MQYRFLLALLLVATATAPAVTIAQNNSTTSQNVTTATPAEPIDSLTVIESTTVEDGRMELVIHSEVVQRVVLTDAGAIWQGGEVPQQDVTLRPGSNRVSIPVTEVYGRVGVTIATRRVLDSTVVETSDPLIRGPFDRGDVQQAALAGLVAGIVVTALIAFKRVRGTSAVPGRVL